MIACNQNDLMAELLRSGAVASIKLGDPQSRVDRIFGPQAAYLVPDFSSLNITYHRSSRLEIWAEHETVVMMVVSCHMPAGAINHLSTLGDVIGVLRINGVKDDPEETFTGLIDGSSYRIGQYWVKCHRDRLHSIGIGEPLYSMPLIRTPGHRRPIILKDSWATVVEASNKVRVILKNIKNEPLINITPYRKKSTNTRKGRLAFRKAESQVLSWMQDPTFMAELLEADARVIRPPQRGWKAGR